MQSIEAISPWLTVYISIDRYVSIKYPARRFFLRKTSTQHILFWLISVICGAYYVPVALFYDITYETAINDTVSTPGCNLIDDCNQSSLLYGPFISIVCAIHTDADVECTAFSFIDCIEKTDSKHFSSRREQNILQRDQTGVFNHFGKFTLHFDAVACVSFFFLSTILFVQRFYGYFLCSFFKLRFKFLHFVPTNSLFRQKFFKIFKN